MKIKNVLAGSVSLAALFLAGCSSQSYNITQYRLPHLASRLTPFVPHRSEALS